MVSERSFEVMFPCGVGTTVGVLVGVVFYKCTCANVYGFPTSGKSEQVWTVRVKSLVPPKKGFIIHPSVLAVLLFLPRLLS